MQKVFQNRMRTIWTQYSNTDGDWSEVREYSSDAPALPLCQQQIQTCDSILYWGESHGHSFRISAKLSTGFLEFLREVAEHEDSSDIGSLIYSHTRQALDGTLRFSKEANMRYPPRMRGSIQNLPRDLRELRTLLHEPQVSKFLEEVELSTSDISNDLDSFVAFSKNSRNIVHGCLRFRNLRFSAEGALVVICGDDLVYGDGIVHESALLAELFELYSSKVSGVSGALEKLYEESISKLSDSKIRLLNNFTSLYVLAHFAQFTSTFRHNPSRHLLENVVRLRDKGLYSAI